MAHFAQGRQAGGSESRSGGDWSRQEDQDQDQAARRRIRFGSIPWRRNGGNRSQTGRRVRLRGERSQDEGGLEILQTAYQGRLDAKDWFKQPCLQKARDSQEQTFLNFSNWTNWLYTTSLCVNKLILFRSKVLLERETLTGINRCWDKKEEPSTEIIVPSSSYRL